jgi:hypothetical protein
MTVVKIDAGWLPRRRGGDSCPARVKAVSSYNKGAAVHHYEQMPHWLPASALVLLAVAACLAMGAACLWAAHQRALRRRTAARHLLEALKAYSAWIDTQCGTSLLGPSPDELSTPEPLARSQALAQRWFPELSTPLVHLLLLHSRTMEFLWRKQLLGLCGAGTAPAWRDPHYQQLRGRQEALIEDLIAHCRAVAGPSAGGGGGGGKN